MVSEQSDVQDWHSAELINLISDLIDEVAEAVREVQFQMLNTQERVIADLTVDAKFSGQVVGAEESTCTDPIR